MLGSLRLTGHPKKSTWAVLTRLLMSAAVLFVTRVQAQLPEPVATALKTANVAPQAAAFVVLPLAPPGLTLAFNETQPMNPASTMKLVTTYAALNLLGPAYSWRTEAYAAGSLRDEVLHGDLILRGSGDPKLTIESFWLLVQKLRGAGLRELRGDLVLDKTVFAPIAHDPAAFDGERLRPYNGGPDALLVNFKAITFSFVPDAQARTVRVQALPPLAGLKLSASVPAAEGPCGDWREKLKADFSQPLAPRFGGAFALACGEQRWHLNLLTHNEYLEAAFRALWEQAGGRWSGRVREGGVPAGARLIAEHESASLAETVRDINKFSNNVMARQLFLALSAGWNGQPASLAASQQRVPAWLAEIGLSMPELVLDNGSGLSRTERISAASLAALLAHAWGSPVMPEFVASLPLVGVDGTMRRRAAAAGFAHVKSGQLNDVRAIAGYVLAASGRRYLVVGILNHPNAPAARAVHDELLRWVFSKG
jgi:D-alanyl-D-alanine carboxypeptidase/D-alanyl-D-alanine-endopeptidase (penicillin-binding protein 4)